MDIVNLVDSQIIASVKSEKDLGIACNSTPNVIFLLMGDLVSSKQHVHLLKSAHKSVFLHLDFIDGLSSSKAAIEYVAKSIRPTGIITTKTHIIKIAKEFDLMTIQRIFLLDRAAVEKGIEMVKSCKPDAVEVMPGVMPKVIDSLTNRLSYPIIAGGLITSIDEIHSALEAGALAVSSGDPKMWNLDL